MHAREPLATAEVPSRVDAEIVLIHIYYRDMIQANGSFGEYETVGNIRSTIGKISHTRRTRYRT